MIYLLLTLLCLTWRVNGQDCYFESNMDYRNNGSYDLGPAIQLPVNIPTLCCHQCGLNPYCQAWSYEPANGLCYLKQAIGQRIYQLGSKVRGFVKLGQGFIYLK